MEIVIILALILINGFLSMSEIALVSARRSRLESAAKKGSKSARIALNLASDPDRFLSTVQIGITLVGILTGLYSGETIARHFGKAIALIKPLAPYSVPIAQVLIIVIVTYLTLIIGELVPKRIGMGAAERVARLVAKPMNFLSKIGSPFVWLLSKSTDGILRLLNLQKSQEPAVTEEEIRSIIEEGTAGGEIQEVEQNIVERVFNLGDRTVGTIMTHRNELIWLDINDPVSAIRGEIQDTLFNVYPVANENLDELLGVVYLKDLFGKIDSVDFRLQQALRPPQFLPENMSVYHAMEELKKQQVKYGLVIDEFGSVEGIVTLNDIVRALLGGLVDENDEPEITDRPDGSWLVDGQCPFYDFLFHLDMEDLYPEYSYNTLSGLILDLLKRIPHTGDTFRWQNLEFEIVDMDGPRIDKVLVFRKKE